MPNPDLPQPLLSSPPRSFHPRPVAQSSVRGDPPTVVRAARRGRGLLRHARAEEALRRRQQRQEEVHPDGHRQGDLTSLQVGDTHTHALSRTIITDFAAIYP